MSDEGEQISALFATLLLALSCTNPVQEAPLRNFRYLDVWHKAHAFTLAVYRETQNFPKSETFGLANMLRRGAANISMKIAEGCGHDTDAGYMQCLGQARGTGMEVEYQLLLARDLQFIEGQCYDVLQDELIQVRKMLTGLIKSRPV